MRRPERGAYCGLSGPGLYFEYFLDAGGHTLRAQRSLPLDATLGQRLYARVAPEHCLVVADPSADGAGAE